MSTKYSFQRSFYRDFLVSFPYATRLAEREHVLEAVGLPIALSCWRHGRAVALVAVPKVLESGREPHWLSAWCLRTYSPTLLLHFLVSLALLVAFNCSFLGLFTSCSQSASLLALLLRFPAYPCR